MPQNSVTPVPFQDPKSPSQLIETEDRYIPDGQNTRLSQVAQKQLVHLPDGSSGFRLQIPVFATVLWYKLVLCTQRHLQVICYL